MQNLYANRKNNMIFSYNCIILFFSIQTYVIVQIKTFVGHVKLFRTYSFSYFCLSTQYY